LLERTTIVVVSDHGMSELSPSRVIFLDDYLDLSTVDVIDWSPNLGLAPLSVSVDQVYHALNGIRIMLVDFWSKGAKYQRLMLWILLGVVLGTCALGYGVSRLAPAGPGPGRASRRSG
jgi:hypothetical protein